MGSRTSAGYFNHATAHPDTVKYWDSRIEAAFIKGIRKYDLGDMLRIDSTNRFARSQRTAVFVAGGETIHAPLPVAFSDSSKLYLLTEDLRGFRFGGGMTGSSSSKHVTELHWLVYDPSRDSVILGGTCRNQTNARNEFWNPKGDRTDWVSGARNVGWDLAEALDRW
jgi:hypothetical protein